MSPDLENRIAEAKDPNTSMARLWVLQQASEIEVRRAILDNPNLVYAHDGLHVNLLISLAKEFPEEVAEHPLFLLHALIEPNLDMTGVVAEIVSRTNDSELIRNLFSIYQGDDALRREFAKSPKTPLDVLRFLGNQTSELDWTVRVLVASNPNATEDILRVLGNPLTEPDWRVRLEVAKNPRTPADVICTLGDHRQELSAMVLAKVAEHHAIDETTIKNLAGLTTRQYFNVRMALISNKKTPTSVLEILSNNEQSSLKERKIIEKALEERKRT